MLRTYDIYHTYIYIHISTIVCILYMLKMNTTCSLLLDMNLENATDHRRTRLHVKSFSLSTLKNRRAAEKMNRISTSSHTASLDRGAHYPLT